MRGQASARQDAGDYLNLVDIGWSAADQRRCRSLCEDARAPPCPSHVGTRSPYSLWIESWVDLGIQ